jgi:hypothetical protein
MAAAYAPGRQLTRRDLGVGPRGARWIGDAAINIGRGFLRYGRAGNRHWNRG